MEALQRLKDLLFWSDRLGSDEKDEIRQIINLLEIENKKRPQTSNTPASAGIDSSKAI